VRNMNIGRCYHGNTAVVICGEPSNINTIEIVQLPKVTKLFSY